MIDDEVRPGVRSTPSSGDPCHAGRVIRVGPIGAGLAVGAPTPPGLGPPPGPDLGPPPFAVLLVLLAAALGALGLVLLRKAAESEPPSRRFSLSLLWLLIRRRPAWSLGILAIVAGFAAQVAALDRAPVTLVQLVVVMELPFSLVLARVFLGGKLRRRDWLAVALMTVGTGVVSVLLRPGGGDPARATAWAWILGLLVTAAGTVALLVVGHRRGGVTRTVLHGTAAGVATGLTAVLVKAVTPSLAGGIVAVATTWQTWVLLGVSIAGFLLLQNAVQAGRLVASQPGITLANPIVAGLWGVGVLGEHVRGGVWLIGAALGAAVMAGGAVLLSRSPLLGGHTEAGHPHAVPGIA